MAASAALVVKNALDDEVSRSNVVRLRGLPFSATEADVIEFFKGLDLGPDGVVMCLNYQGRSTGQAYVQFASEDAANKALERNRQHMGNRYIEVFKGHPSDMQGALRMAGRGSNAMNGGGLLPGGIPGASGNPDMRYTGVVRMRGMPYSATVADITNFFKGIQIVQDGVFLCVHADGRPTGEAFVEFASEDLATRAMQLHREPMGQRYVELFRSTKGEMMTAISQRMYGLFGAAGGFAPFGSAAVGQGMPGLMGGLMGGGLGGGMQGLGMNLAAMQSLGTVGASGMPALQGMGAGVISDGMENTCIKMRGLPYNAGQREILEFFEGYSVAPNGIHIVMGPTDRPTGEAYIEFSSVEEAARAMERHRQNIGSRYIELFRVTKGEMMMAAASAGFGLAHAAAAGMDPSMQLMLMQQQAAAGFMGGGLSGFMGAGQGAAGWGLSDMHAAAAAGYYPPRTGATPSTAAGAAFADPRATVKMRGLPYRTTMTDILDFFREYNVLVDSVRLGASMDGRSNGEAYVTFGSQEEAQRAVREKNRDNIGNRYIELFIAG